MEELLAYTSSHVCLIRILLALDLFLVKPKYLSFCLSYLLLNNYWTT